MPGTNPSASLSTSPARVVLAVLIAFATLLGGVSAAHAADPVDLKIKFKRDTAPTPLGYIADLGSMYNPSTGPGMGWVREDSLNTPSASHKGLSLTDRARDRFSGDQLTRSFVIAETGTGVRGAFEVTVPQGIYDVTVGMGDSMAFDSHHWATVEGRTVIQDYQPTASAPFITGTALNLPVDDGRLTLSELGGTNGKYTYLTIKTHPPDVTAPAPVDGLIATSGTGVVTLNWNRNTTDADLAGYKVFRSTTGLPDAPVVPASGSPGTPISGAAVLTGNSYSDATATPGVRYFYSVVTYDRSGNPVTNAVESNEANGMATAPPPSGFKLSVDFLKAGSPLASGYTPAYQPDTGLSYDDARGYGFVDQATLGAGPHTPLDVTARTRYRTPADPDKRLATLVQLSQAGLPTAAWEAKVAPGYYDVTLAAGDPAAFDSNYFLNVEGVNAINFPASTGARGTVVTVPHVPVVDGRLTIDGLNSPYAASNNKLQYVDIVAASSGVKPAPVGGVLATSDQAGNHLVWAPNSESDLQGYRVYRGTEQNVDISAAATPVSGATPITRTSFDDTTAKANVLYYYAIVAVNTGGLPSDTSNPVGATRPPVPVDLKFDFARQTDPVPTGYTLDYGLAYTTAAKFGWITQDSAPLPTGSHVGVSLSGKGRLRNVVADQRLDTFMHMQIAGGPNGAWEASVPDGTYDVTVAVGDALATDSVASISIEGVPAIEDFLPTNKTHFDTASETVNVSDGRLTIDAIGDVNTKNTKIDYVTIKNADNGSRPSVGEVAPKDGAENVARSRAVTAEVNLPNVGAGIDNATLDSDSVRLINVSTNTAVAANLNTSAGGDVIVLQPRAQLLAQTQYRFEVNSQLKDVSGASFIPKSVQFTTGTATNNVSGLARFIKVPQAQGQGELMASLTIGPDNRLYVTTLDGKILRFPIDDTTGTLGAPSTITTITDHENGPRHILGLAFDPASTPEAPILWVTTGAPEFANAPDWTGKLTRLSGPDLSVADDFVTGFPRSARDHETNSIAFGPDGKIYITQGSNSATGETDVQWGLRKEHLLNAAVLKVDPSLMTAPPLNVKTEDDGSYDPYAAGAPVTIYASGVRNAYDLVWHSNGHLYVPTNGSAANGNLPDVPGTSALPQQCAKRPDVATAGPFTTTAQPGPQHIGVQPDLLFDVQQGGYYGHPNPSRCEYVFFGGNPTTNADPLETVQYAPGTQPDRNWRPPAYNFGNHFSPNGAIQYKSPKFGGRLDGDLLVARYSAGDDIVALPIDGTGKVTDQIDGIAGLGGLDNPLDITEDQRNGNLYVTELSETLPKITLIKPDESDGAPQATLRPDRTVQNAVVNTSSADKTVTIRNTGNVQLRLSDVSLGGADASQFVLDHIPATPQLIDPDQEATVDVKFSPTSVGVKSAVVTFTTNDPANATVSTTLRGLGTAGLQDANEPSLQRILDTYQLPIQTGDDTPDETYMPAGATLGQEVTFQSLKKAGPGKVTIEPLASFTAQGDGSSALSFGWNELSNSDDLAQLSTLPNTDAQSVAPKTSGALSFDPDTVSFGLWATWANPSFTGRTSFTQDNLNLWTGAATHQARAYPLRGADGTVVPNAYVVAFEDVAGTGVPLDYNDLVYVIRNVQPEGTGDGRATVTNLDGGPFDNQLTFNRIGTLANPSANKAHDTGSVQVKNSGTTPFDITSVNVTGNYAVVAPTALPITLAPGATAKVTVKFVAEAGRVNLGALTIGTTSALTPSLKVDLAGYWQTEVEGSNEPKLAELVSMNGFGTTISRPGQVLNNHGHVEQVGDEILSPYWRRIDTSKAVKIQQLSAFHGPGGAGIRYYLRSGDHAGSAIKSIMSQNDQRENQIVLPHIYGSNVNGATTTFTPPAEFGFQVGGNEFSDPTLNSTAGDTNSGCTSACGHHVRVWPAKTKTGQAIAGSYLISMDYSAAVGVNYDYNDNLFLVSNITPDTDTQPVLARVDTGTSTSFTDSRGRLWSPDTGLYSPPAAVNEGTNPTTSPIANTVDDTIYGSYRGNVGNVPIASRILDYRFPTRTATKVDIRLHFAERYWTSANSRLFNVYAEGSLLNSKPIDIFSLAGGKDTAYTMAFNNIPISDGALDLRFATTKDYPSIAGIEVLCAETCGSD